MSRYWGLAHGLCASEGAYRQIVEEFSISVSVLPVR